MQTLRNLLISLSNITLILQEMQDRRAAYAINNRIKAASSLLSTDFVDVADYIEEAISYAELCEQDVVRLRAIVSNLRNCNQHLHLTQNLILSA